MRKKITTELCQFRKVNRMCDFGVAHRNAFAPGTPGANALDALESAVGHLKIQTAAQASTENRLRELLRIKLDARQDLHEDVELLYHTAHAVALEKRGFDDKFQSSLQGDPKLLNAARSAVKDAAPAAETFVSHAMPQDFIEALDAKVRRLEQAREEYANGRTACALGEKELRASLRKAVAAAQAFDAVMRQWRGENRGRLHYNSVPLSGTFFGPVSIRYAAKSARVATEQVGTGRDVATGSQPRCARSIAAYGAPLCIQTDTSDPGVLRFGDLSGKTSRNAGTGSHTGAAPLSLSGPAATRRSTASPNSRLHPCGTNPD